MIAKPASKDSSASPSVRVRKLYVKAARRREVYVYRRLRLQMTVASTYAKDPLHAYNVTPHTIKASLYIPECRHIFVPYPIRIYHILHTKLLFHVPAFPAPSSPIPHASIPHASIPYTNSLCPDTWLIFNLYKCSLPSRRSRMGALAECCDQAACVTSFEFHCLFGTAEIDVWNLYRRKVAE